MCDYCKHHYWFDENDEDHEIMGKPILDETLNLITKAEVEDNAIEGELNCIRELAITVDIWNFEDKRKYMAVSADTEDGIKEELRFTKEIPIKYCPMCGRKL